MKTDYERAQSGLAASHQEVADRFHAKQQYADFVKAAMQGLLSSIQHNSQFDSAQIANDACAVAEATLEEMTRRGK